MHLSILQALKSPQNAPQPKQEQKDLPKIEQVTQQAFSQLLKVHMTSAIEMENVYSSRTKNTK